MEKPYHVTEAMLSYLDQLRDSGKVNMYDAVPYLESHYGLLKSDAKLALEYWMKTYTARHPK